MIVFAVSKLIAAAQLAADLFERTYKLHDVESDDLSFFSVCGFKKKYEKR